MPGEASGEEVYHQVVQGAVEDVERYGFPLDERPSATFMEHISDSTRYGKGHTSKETVITTGRYDNLFDEVLVYESQSPDRQHTVGHECIHKYFVDNYTAEPVDEVKKQVIGDALYDIARTMADSGEIEDSSEQYCMDDVLEELEQNKTGLRYFFGKEINDIQQPVRTAVKYHKTGKNLRPDIADCESFEEIDDIVDEKTYVRDSSVTAYLHPFNQRDYNDSLCGLEEATAQFYDTAWCNWLDTENRQKIFDTIKSDESLYNRYVKDWLQQAFTHYDSLAGTQEERIQDTFQWFRDTFDQEHERSYRRPARA